MWWLQVLILEHGKVLRPARLAVRGAAEEPAVMLSLVCPMEEVGPGLGSWGGSCRPSPTHPFSSFLQKAVSCWKFPPAAIRGVR